jgi:hypothetical protein
VAHGSEAGRPQTERLFPIASRSWIFGITTPGIQGQTTSEPLAGIKYPGFLPASFSVQFFDTKVLPTVFQ